MKLSSLFFSAKMIIKSAMQRTEKELTIKAPWGNIAGLTWGASTNPPVLLCHGKLDVCSSFRPLVLSLPDSFFYVSVDLPGNGRSDHLPPGVMFTPFDLLPAIKKVKEHFKWTSFVFIGHSLGAFIGKYYNIAYPGQISRMVELDPIPVHEAWSPDSLGEWYKMHYADYYDDDKYGKFNGSKEKAPKYSYEKVLDMVMSNRNLPKEVAEQILERCLEPAGEGMYRLTFDQRMKQCPTLPVPPSLLRSLYTASEIPIMAFLAQIPVNLNVYRTVPFVKDMTAWPNKNYKVKIVPGGHDLHISNPERIAGDISRFLVEKSKL